MALTASDLVVIGRGRLITAASTADLLVTVTDRSHGTGPEVRGPLLSLALAMTGRRPALDDLVGDGIELMTTRMPPA